MKNALFPLSESKIKNKNFILDIFVQEVDQHWQTLQFDVLDLLEKSDIKFGDDARHGLHKIGSIRFGRAEVFQVKRSNYERLGFEQILSKLFIASQRELLAQLIEDTQQQR